MTPFGIISLEVSLCINFLMVCGHRFPRKAEQEKEAASGEAKPSAETKKASGETKEAPKTKEVAEDKKGTPITQFYIFVCLFVLVFVL